MSYVSVLIVFSFASRQTIFKAMKETPYFLPFHSVQTYRDLPFWYFKSVISRCKSSTWGTTPRLMFWRHFWSRTNFLCFCMCLSPTIIIFVSISIIKALLDSSGSKLSVHSTGSKPQIACQFLLIKLLTYDFSWHRLHTCPMPDPKSLATSISTLIILFIALILSTHLCICQCSFLSIKQSDRANSFALIQTKKMSNNPLPIRGLSLSWLYKKNTPIQAFHVYGERGGKSFNFHILHISV